MIYYVLFSTWGIADSVLMKMDYTNNLNPIGTILETYAEIDPDDKLEILIQQLESDNKIVHRHTIHIADVTSCIEEITPQDIANAAAKVFTPSLLSKSSILQKILS